MMEWIYSSADQTIPKIKGINSHMSLWPVNAKMDGKFVINRGGSHQSRSSGYEPLPTPGLVHTVGDGFSTPIMIAGRSRTMLQNRYRNSNSKNISYGSRGSSPLSAIEILDKLSPSMLRTPPGFSTSVKDDEDVLMMDGILVGGMMRFAMESGGSSSSSTSSAYNFFKTELCRSWEDSGSCRFGSKCQVQICKSNATTVVCTYGTNCSFFHPVTTAAESAAATGNRASSVKVEKGSRGIISITGRMWSPQDDGIEITLTSSIKKPPATEHVDICIQAVLYDATPRRRLQVFAEICPDHSYLAHSY